MTEPTDPVEKHLRQHLTDGHWHDSCHFCLRRRVYGGDGTVLPLSAGRMWRERLAALGYEAPALYGGYIP